MTNAASFKCDLILYFIGIEYMCVKLRHVQELHTFQTSLVSNHVNYTGFLCVMQFVTVQISQCRQ